MAISQECAFTGPLRGDLVIEGRHEETQIEQFADENGRRPRRKVLEPSATEAAQVEPVLHPPTDLSGPDGQNEPSWICRR